MIDLETNLRSVRERIAAAARQAGRDPDEVTLVAITKTHAPATILAAYRLGLRHFGENRVEEVEAKAGALPAGVTWHMVGHIQSRKARRVVPLVHIVHSVDSVDLARRLDRACLDRAERLPVLLQCNVSGEESKYGFATERWAADGRVRQSFFESVEQILALPHLAVEGLMTMAPIVDAPEQTRPIFAGLRRLRDALRDGFPQAGWHHLSMGMSDDFEVAVEEGATFVRIGRALFALDQPSQRS